MKRRKTKERKKKDQRQPSRPRAAGQGQESQREKHRVKEREKRKGLEEKHGVGETFSTKNTLSTIVPRTQKRKQLTKQQEDKRAMDLTKSDDERKTGLNNQDPNLPDYEKSSSDEESVTYVSEAGAEPTETRASEKKADELGQKATVQTTSRTHCGYDWAIGEVVKYNKMGKSNDCVVLEAVIDRFPKVLPTTDYYAKAYIRVLATPKLPAVCINVRSLEKKEKTAKHQRPSTLKQEAPRAPIDVEATSAASGGDSDQDTAKISHLHSSKKRKADERNTGGTPRSPGGATTGQWQDASAEHIAQQAALPVPDAKTKEAFKIFLQAMIEGLNGPTNAEITMAKGKLERRYRQLQKTHTAARKELEDAGAAGTAARLKIAQRETQIGVLRTQVRTLEDQAKAKEATAAEAQAKAEELASTKRLYEEAYSREKALKNRIEELQANMNLGTYRAQKLEQLGEVLAKKDATIAALEEGLAKAKTDAIQGGSTEEAPEVATTKLRNEELTAQVTSLEDRIKELQATSGRPEGAAQGGAEIEAALAAKNQELDKLTKALAEKDKEISQLKAALKAFV